MSFFENPLVSRATFSASCAVLGFALNVAGRDFDREAAYYVTLYCNYLCRAVAARSVVYSQVGYAVGLYDHAMVGLAPEGIADGVLVRQEAIGADLRLA
ncbi:hypothetical protein [Bradyrhizobium japonicum]|uniref:hypothetical protein n=1 Tax=Bradyrhizobium japonicum TaxID=375 RepID=UPI0018AD51A0|nr:hypothetical protein [Bradyrhizobium japonicum]